MRIESDSIDVLELTNLEINVIKKILEYTRDFKEGNLRNIDGTDPDSIVEILNENESIDGLFKSITNKISGINIINILPKEFKALKKGIEFKYNKDTYFIDIAANKDVRKDLLDLLKPLEMIYNKFNICLDNF
jgi:hypothetical protein